MLLLWPSFPIDFVERAGAALSPLLVLGLAGGLAMLLFVRSAGDKIGPMSSKPSVASVVICACASVVSMMAGVYFGGSGRIPLAMLGTALFVLFGGIAFELARRRSV